jgi:hypothetical protein
VHASGLRGALERGRGPHGSLYNKRTALKTGGPAPRGLDLFHIAEVNGALVVDTNPLNLMRRPDNVWHADQVEVADDAA